jgi:hypothetical protein
MVAAMSTLNEPHIPPTTSFSRPEAEFDDDLDDELERAFNQIEAREPVEPSHEELDPWHP